MNDAIQKVVFPFLKDLAEHNNREWFNDHKDEYEQAKRAAQLFFDSLNTALGENDQLENCKMYRIYRDTRFSKDKTPYKNHFGAILSRRQPHNRGSFYVHLEPGNTFIGAGFWGPEKEDLYRIRKAIEVEDDLELILADKKLQNKFGALQGEQLKTVPKGFEKEHPRVQLLRFKQYLFTQHFTDEQVFSAAFVEQIVESYKTLAPFYEYMSAVLTTDENGESII